MMFPTLFHRSTLALTIPVAVVGILAAFGNKTARANTPAPFDTFPQAGAEENLPPIKEVSAPPSPLAPHVLDIPSVKLQCLAEWLPKDLNPPPRVVRPGVVECPPDFLPKRPNPEPPPPVVDSPPPQRMTTNSVFKQIN